MTGRYRFSPVALTFALILLPLSGSLFAIDCSVPSPDFGTSPGNIFSVTSAGFTNSDIQTAADYWKCPGYSGEIPTFLIGGSGGVQVTVVRKTGNSTATQGGCGRFTPSVVNGRLESAIIEVWTHQADGQSCAPLTDSVAHEFGHLLGLANAPDPLGECLGHIMGSRVAGFTRTVGTDDCDVADQKWETTDETQPPSSDPYCDAYCWTGCVNSTCPTGNPWCPILVDMENDGIRLTGLSDPVWFDIDADGDPDLMSWTDRSEGILALDRNGNGAIDHGGELFGNATRLASGYRASNGYEALAEFDSWLAGGNGDGVIDTADAIFGVLWLWTDRDHDGISQPEELSTLDQAGLRRIGLDYRSSRRLDRHGNEFRFLGRAWKAGRSGGLRPLLTWDVFFVVQP
jgi:hypothetical protein